MIRFRFVFIFFFSFFSSYAYSFSKVSIEEKTTNMIYCGQPYASFTSLVYYKNSFYCSFREAENHVDVSGIKNGKIKILKSSDGNNWEDYLIIEEPGFDLREAKLSITPQNKLMALVEKVKYKDGKAFLRQSNALFISVDGSHSDLIPIFIENGIERTWLWDISWINRIAYGWLYSPYFALVKSNNGIDYDILNVPNIDYSPSEASIIKYKDCYVSLVRRGREAGAYLGTSRNAKQWEWFDIGVKIESPQLVKYKNHLLGVCRIWDNESQRGRTILFEIDIKKKEFIEIEELSASKDNAYPGLVLKKNVLYVSHYIGDGYNSNVYLSVLKLK